MGCCIRAIQVSYSLHPFYIYKQEKLALLNLGFRGHSSATAREQAKRRRWPVIASITQNGMSVVVSLAWFSIELLLFRKYKFLRSLWTFATVLQSSVPVVDIGGNSVLNLRNFCLICNDLSPFVCVFIFICVHRIFFSFMNLNLFFSKICCIGWEKHYHIDQLHDCDENKIKKFRPMLDYIRSSLGVFHTFPLILSINQSISFVCFSHGRYLTIKY